MNKKALNFIEKFGLVNFFWKSHLFPASGKLILIPLDLKS
jgi:hypothetical protein